MWKDLEGAELAGFRLERYLAHGGQAGVFVGVSLAERDERRAIKLVDPLLARDESFKQRFFEEARALKRLERLEHPNIVGFRDVRIAPAMRGQEVLRNGERLMALELELLEGRTLLEVQESGERPAVEDVLNWCAQACDGLSAAHEDGLIHRDIKPGNVFVCADGVVKVIDFGIAQAICRADADSKGRLTKSGHTAGTPLYMAPELWTGTEVTAQADIYALGLTLAQVLLGRHPFVGEDGRYPSDFQVMLRHTQEDLRGKLAKPNLRLHQPVEDLVMRLCARDPGQRPGSAAAAAAEIRAVRDRLLSAKAGHTGGEITLGAVKMLAMRRAVSAADSLQGGPTPVGPPVTRPAVDTGGIPQAARFAVSKTTWSALGGLLAAFSLAVVSVYAVRAVNSDETATGEPAPNTSGGAAAGAVVPSAATGDVDEAAPDSPTLPAPGALPTASASTPEPRDPNPFIDVVPPVGRLVMSRQMLAPTEAYRLQAHEVTWGELHAWDGFRPEERQMRAGETDDMPATGLSWERARAYCTALDCPAPGCDLPTEAQWEYAARGPELRPLPWGTSGSARDAHVYRGRGALPSAVTVETADVTPGEPSIRDLLGNVREWMLDPWREASGAVMLDEANKRSWYVLRGLPLAQRTATFPSTPITFRAAGCAWTCDNALGEETGFRCASPSLLAPAPGVEVAEPAPAALPTTTPADASGCAVSAGSPMLEGAWWGLLVLGLVVARSARRSWHRRRVHGAVNAGLQSALVSGPSLAAHDRILDGVHSACARCALGV
jgi:hypothetical protein